MREIRDSEDDLITLWKGSRWAIAVLDLHVPKGGQTNALALHSRHRMIHPVLIRRLVGPFLHRNGQSAFVCTSTKCAEVKAFSFACAGRARRPNTR